MALSCFAIGCGSDADPDDDELSQISSPLEESDELAGPFERPFYHPLQAGLTADGKVPLLEQSDSPSGHRYAIGDGGVIFEEEGEEHVFSGVIELPYRALTPDELLEAEAEKGPEPAQVLRSVDTISARLSSWMSDPSGESRDLDISLHRPDTYVSRTTRDELEIGRQGVQTRAEYDTIRQENLNKQRLEVASVVSAVRTEVEALGGTVLYECENIYCMKVRLTPSQAALLAPNSKVARIDPEPTMSNNAIYGVEVANGHQMKLLIDYYHLGNPHWVPMKAGVLEHQRVFDDHYGFWNGAQPSNSRIAQLRECKSFWGLLTCLTSSGWSPSQAGDHATMVAGLMLGDLTDGQDPNVINTTWQKRRSGYGREAQLKFWSAPTDPYIILALDDIAGDLDIHILNMSIADQDGDPTCSGTGFLSRAINDLYDAGILTFFAAGNAYTPDDPDDCTVEEPGAAMGAFVVGATLQSAESGSETTVRTGPLRSSSDRGGTWVEGQNRYIIDLVATGVRKGTFLSSGGYRSSSIGGTSVAAPTVAGAALQFADWYTVSSSSAIDNPGILHAHMLLMGDRTIGISGGSDIKANTNAHNRWGAGRMKMRRWDGIGLDGPSGWGSWSTCIKNGQAYYHNLNGGNPISTDTDALKALIYWYDRRHEDGTPIDDLDLRLERKVNGVWTSARSSATYSKHWERIFWDDFSGYNEYRLRIYGWSVTSDNAEGCGVNEMRVRIAWFHEDSDREAHEGLDNVDPE